jgi:translocation and assembly module TamB
MRRTLKILAWALGGMAAMLLLAVAVLWMAGNTAGGRALIERATLRLTAGYVKLDGLGGSFPAQLTLAGLELRDRGGVWLSAERIALRWAPLALFERRIAVEDLVVGRIEIARAPLPGPSTGPVSVPHIDVARFSIAVLQLDAPLTGSAATLSVRGGGRMRSLQDADAEFVAHRSDGAGEYSLNFKFDRQRMDGTLAVHEPASGPLENILNLPGLGALDATVNLHGPHRALTVKLALGAGTLRAQAAGTIDATRQSADLDYSLEAPAMSPRADVAWQRLVLRGSWHGTVSAPTAQGHLEVEGLRAVDIEIATLNADLTGTRGNLSLAASIHGLKIPGPQPQLLARDPMQIQATVRLDEASRPLDLSVSQRLFTLRAQATTAGALGAALDLRMPDVAPFALLAGQDIHGPATLKAQLARRSADLHMALGAELEVAQGAAAWSRLFGKKVALQAAGALSAAAFDVESLRLTALGATFSLNGHAARPSAAAPGAAPPAGRPFTAGDYIKELQARWELTVADLALIGAEFAGDLHASGRVSGAPAALAGDAALSSALSIRGSPKGTVSAELHAHGVPSAPSGTLQAHGMLDGAPLKLGVALERDARGGATLQVREADWKSAHAQGSIVLGSGIADSRGALQVRVGQLGDLDRLLGLQIDGSVEGSASFTPVQGRTHTKFQLDGQSLVVGGLAGDAQLSGEGPWDSLSLELALHVPNFNGDAARIAAQARLDLAARNLRIASLSADYRALKVTLLSPATVSFADGLSIDQLKLGAQTAVLEVGGGLSPGLDVHASLRELKPPLINAFVPNLLTAGTVQATARLQGRIGAPTGEIRMSATGLRLPDEAAALPVMEVRASAELAGDTAALDAHLTAGDTPLLAVTGTAPLNAAGAFALKILGKLDVGLANPLFEARGMHAAGRLDVDATLDGPIAAPQIRGTIKLAQASVRDYARGLNLTNISAVVTGSEGTLQIESFKGSAGSGSIGLSGSIGVLQPDIPVDLKFTANRADAITSNIVTANVNSELTLSGTARERLTVAGVVHINRAVIGVPDSLPPNVAVLDVRRRGKAAPPVIKRLSVVFDVSIQAPQQILVQGRGLDAELGGELHLAGTTDAPLVSGGFDLQRGSFTIGSTKLTLSTPGRVSFDGTGLKKSSIDPMLDFTAQTTVANVTATLHISGYADAPKFDFSSVPAQPQDEIMALLLFGEPAAQLSALQAAQIGAALANLSGVGGSGLNPITKLQRSLGLDRLSVGQGTTTSATGAPENSGAAIQAGRYISKRVYVEGKQSSTGQSQVEVDVDLTKHLKVQTRLGNGTAIQGTTPDNDPGSSIGLSYQFEY